MLLSGLNGFDVADDIKKKAHDSRAVANCFVRLAQEKGKTITIMQLVKFVYLAHGWHLGHYYNPLIRHDVEAWRLGPVVPEVYNAFRPQGVVVDAPVRHGYITSQEYEGEFNRKAKKLIRGVFDVYVKLPAYALSGLTHKPGTPWHKVKDKGFYAPIDDKIIRDYYHKKVRAGS